MQSEPTRVQPAWATRSFRPTVVFCLILLAVEVVLLVVVAHGAADRSPRSVPIVIAVPGPMAPALVGAADSMDGHPFDAESTTDPADARAAVSDGSAAAALVVDLSGTEDTVEVDARNDADLNRATVDRIRTVEQRFDRTAVVHQQHRDHANATDRVRRFTLGVTLLGFLVVLVISLVRGPVARSLTLGVLRVVGLAVASVAGGLLVTFLPATSLPGNRLELVALAAAATFSAGIITLAFESLAGLAGLAVAAVTFFLLATPLLTGTSRYLLPPPWPRVAAWTPTGAVQQAASEIAYFDPAHVLGPALVLLASSGVALAVLLVARYARRRAGLSDELGPAPVRMSHWRLFVLGTVAPLAVLLLVGIALLPAPVVASAGRLPSLASQSDCLSEQRPASVSDLNRISIDSSGGDAFLGGDVGADVRLQDGRALWIFGDTLRSKGYDGGRFARNSMLVWNQDCIAVVLPENHGALVPNRFDGVGYWPMSVAVAHRTGYDYVTVSTQRVATSGGQGAFDFDNLGPAMAIFVVPRGGTPQLIAQQDIGPDDADRSRPEWGAAMAVDHDWLYLYGTASPGKSLVFGFSLQVARVHPEDVLDVSKWRYWDGSTWAAQAASAKELIPAEDGVSQTLSVFQRHGRWYALSKRNDFLGSEVLFWTAPGPTGPFTATAPVAEIPSDPQEGVLRYMPLAHPDVLPAKHSMVISYSRNRTVAQDVLADPSRYRPRFLRVPLPQ